MFTSTDRIETSILLRAPHDRVWRAISDAKQFETWFGAELDGPFAHAARLTGRIGATKVDAGIGRAQKPYLGTAFELNVDRVESMRLLSFVWHPLATHSGAPGEPATLVEFELDEAASGTRLTITESGFGQIPPARHGTAGAPAEQPEQPVSCGLWRPRQMGLLVEKLLAGAVDHRPQAPPPHQSSNTATRRAARGELLRTPPRLSHSRDSIGQRVPRRDPP